MPNDKQDQYVEAINKAKDNLVNYRKIILETSEDEVEASPEHYRWSDLLLNGTENEAIEAFRESGKTQYVLRAFLLYAIQFPHKSRDYIVLIKANTKLAQQKLKEIETEYNTNPAVSSNCIRIKEQTLDVFSVDVRDEKNIKRNVRIEAYGKGSAIRGLVNVDRRPKIVIIDDPQDLSDASSPATQIADWNWFLADVKFLGKSTRIFIIGNNLGESCIIERIAENAPELGFNFTRVPVLTPEGKAAWPEKDSVEEILKERSNFDRIGKLDIWLREKMCVSVCDENRIFVKDDFRYFSSTTANKVRQTANAFISFDPATSLKDSSDYRAIMLNLVTPDNDWFIADCAFGRWDTIQAFDELFRMVTAWGVRDVGIEDGIWKQALAPILAQEMKRRNQFFNVVPLKHGGIRKEERIRTLQPRFSAHQIYFPDKAPWMAEMESELLSFTMQGMRGLHDDLLDVLAYFEQFVRKPYKPGHNQKGLPRMAQSNYAIF